MDVDRGAPQARGRASNKQLNFVQHIATILNANGRAAVVLPDKANLDSSWLKDGSLQDIDNLPSADVIVREIVEDLTGTREFEAVVAALEEQLGGRGAGTAGSRAD